LAPGYLKGPFLTSCLRNSTFQGVTRSGTVSLFAISSGTPTSDMSMLGSGDITVLAEKSTRLPDRLPLNLPSLPFSLWASVLSGRPDL
jgi:hypothetical protein